MQAEVFTMLPNELKTIEIDTEKKIFKINGENFGERCTGFYIDGDAVDGFDVRMRINTDVLYVSKYNIDGKKNDSPAKVQGLVLNDNCSAAEGKEVR